MRSEALTETISHLVAQQPFFAVYLFDMMQVVETDTTPDGMPNPTAATDGKTIYVSTKWFAGLKLSERVFVLAHEVMHGIYQHMARAKGYADRGFGRDLKPWSHSRWNKAGDYVINATLTESNVGTMPMEGLYHPKITSADLVDDVYEDIPDDDDDKQGHDQHLIPLNPDDLPTDGEIKTALAAAKNAAKAMGKMPGALERLVGNLMDPEVDWKEKLRNLMTSAAGRDSATWQRSNRRRMAMAPHMYFPGTTGFQVGGVAVVIDTSGSISDAELTAFMTETASIMAECKPEWAKVLWTDSQVAHVDEVDDPEDLTHLKAHGGGGTHMPAAFNYMEEYGIEPETCVVLTDMYTAYGEQPPYKVIWASTTAGKEAPFGEHVYLSVNS